MRRRDELPERARLADDRRQLRAGHDQHPHVVLGEDARLDRLHDQHALQQAAIDDRHAEERAIRILAGLAEVLEARMRRRVGDDLRLQLFGDEAGEPFGEPHADAADAFRAAARWWRRAPGSRGRLRAGRPSRRRCRTAAESGGRCWSASRTALPLCETRRLISSSVQSSEPSSW